MLVFCLHHATKPIVVLSASSACDTILSDEDKELNIAAHHTVRL
jgi:hypothetical protein